MIYAVTVNVDIQTIDPAVPGKFMGRAGLIPGASRVIPGGMVVFQSAWLNDTPGEASLYRFSLQFGSIHAAALVGNWLFAQLYGTAAALHLAGHLIPIDHPTIIRGLRQVA